jgi:hypothetical protein
VTYWARAAGILLLVVVLTVGQAALPREHRSSVRVGRLEGGMVLPWGPVTSGWGSAP